MVESMQDPRRSPRLEELRRAGFLPVLEGRSIDQFDGLRDSDHSRWSTVPTRTVRTFDIPQLLHRIRYYRLALRRKVGSPKSNRRSVRAALIPPGLAACDSLYVESEPQTRRNADKLALLALLNSTIVDHHARPHIQVMLTKVLLKQLPAVELSESARTFVVHAALRLTATEGAYAALWEEQMKGAWREATPPHTWPVLANETERRLVQASIDPVIARSYGLDRTEYEAVVHRFDRPDDEVVASTYLDLKQA